MASKKHSGNARKKDTSPYVHQRKKVDVNINVSEKIPWTEKQQEFIRLAQDKQSKLIFLNGCAGVGKTILSVYCGLHALKEKKVSDIIYVRSVIESASQKLGYLPGDFEEKFSPYLKPLADKLDELVSAGDKKALLANDLVSGMPINYLRGSHFAGKYIIIDEAQNFDIKEMTTILTRIGEYSKVIVMGDPMQSDINGRSAFKKVSDAFDNEEGRENGIFNFRFGTEDIVRSELVRYIVEVLEDLS